MLMRVYRNAVNTRENKTNLINNKIMKPQITKAFLTSHITVSVGWFGAAAVFLVLAITSILSKNVQAVNSAYMAMEISAWFIILPFCIASLVTGIIQALITRWGLLNHYWIIVKLILTLGSTILLILHLKPIAQLAHLANDANVAIAKPGLQMQMVADSGAALLVLLTMITISIYKPWGKTNYTIQGKGQAIIAKGIREKTSLRKYALIAVIVLLIFIVIKHLTGGGMHGH